MNNRVIFSDTHEGLIERIERLEKDNRLKDIEKIIDENIDEKIDDITNRILNISNIIADILNERNAFEPQYCTIKVKVHCPKCESNLIVIPGHTSQTLACECKVCNHKWMVPMGSVL